MPGILDMLKRVAEAKGINFEEFVEGELRESGAACLSRSSGQAHSTRVGGGGLVLVCAALHPAPPPHTPPVPVLCPAFLAAAPITPITCPTHHQASNTRTSGSKFERF